MFLILVDGQAKGLCDKPNYVKRKNGIWIDGTENDHEAIAIGGTAYEGAVAKVADSGEYVFNLNEQTVENTSSISDVQDALMELADIISESEQGE